MYNSLTKSNIFKSVRPYTMNQLLGKFVASTKPESDNDNYYFRYVSLDLFSWTRIVDKINMASFNPKDIENKVPKEEYEKVLSHIQQTTKRLRRTAAMIVYLWLIIAFTPLTSFLSGTDLTPLVILSYGLMSLLLLLPLAFYYLVYGQRENLAMKTKLALDEMNDREYNHRGVHWSLTEDGNYMHLQMNFAHYRQKKSDQTDQTSFQTKTSQYTPPSFVKSFDIEVPEIFSEADQNMLDIIRGKKTKNLTTPLIKA